MDEIDWKAEFAELEECGLGKEVLHGRREDDGNDEDLSAERRVEPP